MTEQRQDSLLEQLRDVIVLAEQNGCYDAADWIRKSLGMAMRFGPRRYSREQLAAIDRAVQERRSLDEPPA